MKNIFFVLGIVLVSVLSLFVLFDYQLSKAANYSDGTLLKSPLHTSVYYIENNKRRAFPNSQVYHTWFNNFDDVQTITVEQMEAIELGNPMSIKANTKLLKFPLNPKVYSVISGEVIRHIPDESTAKAMFGVNWNSIIIELPEIYFLFYTKGEALDKIVLNDEETGDTTSDEETGDTTSDDSNCSSGMLLYKNTEKGYEFCYNDTGEVKTNQYGGVVFSRLKGGEEGGNYDGLIGIVEGFDSLFDYIAQLDGTVDIDEWGYNSNDVYYRAYNHAAGGWSGYEVVFQNQINKNIVRLSYMSADGNDKFFIDGPRNTFSFLDTEANGLDPWESNTIVGDCPEYPNTKNLFQREYQFHSYRFCYGVNWKVTIGNGDTVLVLPADGANFELGYGEFSIGGTNGLNEYNSIKTDTTGYISNLSEFTTKNGDVGLEYDSTEPSEREYHNISLFDSQQRRADFLFSEYTGEYQNNFFDLKQDIVNTFKFIDY